MKLGATRRNQSTAFQEIDADKWISHKDFDFDGYKNDIALIKLKKSYGKNKNFYN